MGNTSDASGALDFNNDATNGGSGPVADFQALSDRIEKIGGLLKLTATERLNLTPGQTKAGWLIAETDTGRFYLRTPDQPLGMLLHIPDTGEIALQLSAGWSGSATLRVRDNYASLNGRISSSADATASPFAQGIPERGRPVSERVTFAFEGGSEARHTPIIQPGGGFVLFGKSGAVNDLRLATIPPWPVSA